MIDPQSTLGRRRTLNTDLLSKRLVLGALSRGDRGGLTHGAD